VSRQHACVERPAGVIRGVYKYCDDWCEYCPVTARCLSFRVRQERMARRGSDGIHDVWDMVAFTRELAAAAGESTTDLDAVLAGDPRGEYQPAPADEWLLHAAHQYAGAAGHFLRQAGWVLPASGRPAAPPSPVDVVAWYHLLLAARAGRALISMARAERGCDGALEDAQGCAKIALISIDRSVAALRALSAGGRSGTVRRLASMLEQLAVGLEARVPGARSFVRVGLDAPVV
jgi:hypothetical protein